MIIPELDELTALLTKYENTPPQVVFEWHDSETNAEGWLVINSLRSGAAGGGTRMRKGLNRREVESLAKTMEIKFTVTGPPIGGGKSGINFDPNDPRKNDVLKRWYQAVLPLLKNYYGTGGDLNVDEIHEVIPITADLGLAHPQEGVLKGHLKPTPELEKKLLEHLKLGVSKIIESEEFSPDLSRQYTVADMITGYGVSESIRNYYDIWGGTIVGKKAIIQGWGNVAAAAGFFMAKAGAVIIGIIDQNGGVFNSKGFSLNEIRTLFLNRKGNRLNAPNLIPFDEINRIIWNSGAEIFAPCAASRLLTRELCQNLIQNGLEVMSCGANVPFADDEIFFGPIADFTDQNTSLIPDFVANCGMARVFAFLMLNEGPFSDKSIFEDTSLTIRKALNKIFNFNSSKRGLARTALSLALNEIMKN